MASLQKVAYELLPAANNEETAGSEQVDTISKLRYGPERSRILDAAHVRLTAIAGAFIVFIGGTLFASLAGKRPVPASNQLPRAELCDDTYSTFGYIWRGKLPNDIRWIPYNLDNAPGSEGETSGTPYRLEDVVDPPPTVLASAPTSWNSIIESSDDLANDVRLDFLRNRTVTFVGDSHDRKGIEGFCAHHRQVGAYLASRGGHIATRCIIPALNFTLSSLFHYGMVEADETWYQLSSEMDPAPYSVEGRLPAMFEAELAETGTPSLIVLNSVYWDLVYFTRKAAHEEWQDELRRAGRPLTWGELRWHRQRLAAYVELFRKRFPGVPIMYRPGQLRANNEHSGNVDVYQINESAKFAMQKLGVPIFPWGAHLIGEEDYADDMHVNIVSQATYLYGDMALYYLGKVVDGSWRMSRPDGVCA